MDDDLMDTAADVAEAKRPARKAGLRRWLKYGLEWLALALAALVALGS